MPDLSICILTHRQPVLLHQCVASCFSEVARAGVAGEVILIDNASVDGSPQRVAERFPGVKVIRNEQNLGFSAANNLGVRNSQGRFILLLNDDAVLRPGSLRLLLQDLEADPKLGAVGPKLIGPDGSPQQGYTNRQFPHLLGIVCFLLHLDRLFRKWSWTAGLFTLERPLGQSAEAEHLTGACLLLRREAWDRVGGFDEGFYYQFEDTDLCYRLKKAGWQLFYRAEAEVTHYGSASLDRLPRAERAPIYLRSLIYYFKKHSGRWGYFALRLMLGVILALRVPLAALFALFQKHWTREQRNDFVRASLTLLRTAVMERPPLCP